MAGLLIRHPETTKEFNNGKFVVHKTRQAFSRIPIDQAHEQNNALIKVDGGAVGLTDNLSASQHCMVVGPEVARVVEEFHKELYHCYVKSIQLTMIKPQLSKLPLVRMCYP